MREWAVSHWLGLQWAMVSASIVDHRRAGISERMIAGYCYLTGLAFSAVVPATITHGITLHTSERMVAGY